MGEVKYKRVLLKVSGEALAGESKVGIDNEVTEGNNPMYVTKSITGLLNNVGKIFRDRFKENPEFVPKVDVKLRRKIVERVGTWVEAWVKIYIVQYIEKLARGIIVLKQPIAVYMFSR